MIFALNDLTACSNTSNARACAHTWKLRRNWPMNKGRATLDSLNALIIDNPNDFDVLNLERALYLGARNLAYAQADINAVLAADSNRVGALEILGDLGFATNITRESRDAWQKCMRLDPEYVPCRLKMAQLYHVVTEFEKVLSL